MSPTAPDAVDQLKKAFKGLFGKKNAKKDEPVPTATVEQPSASTTKPTETTPAAPAPATAPEPVTSETAPASTGTAPAAAPAPAPVAAPVAEPAAAPAESEPTKDEAAALAEVKPATQSRSTSLHNCEIARFANMATMAAGMVPDGGRRLRWIVTGEVIYELLPSRFARCLSAVFVFDHTHRLSSQSPPALARLSFPFIS